jgi:hypothetical protein
MAKRKQKSKLAKVMNDTEEQHYETKETDCRFWFSILNKEIFDGRLCPVDEIDIRQRRMAYAYYECEEDEDYSYTRILMNNKYKSKQFFICVLCHEMCHHYQFLHNEPLGHGPSFMKWKEKINKKGIDLRTVYIEK